MVGVLVPAAQEAMRVLCSLQTQWVDILQAVPENFTAPRVKAVVPQSGQDAGTLGQGPDTVVLETGSEADEVDDQDTADEGVLHEVVLGVQDGVLVVP